MFQYKNEECFISTVQTKKAFVLIPPHSPFDFYYAAIFKSALEAVGYIVGSRHEASTSQTVLPPIPKRISEADLILCDMSEKHPDIFYDLGVAQAIGKNTILLSRREIEIPSALQNLQYIKYDDNEASWESELRGAIQERAKASLLWHLNTKRAPEE